MKKIYTLVCMLVIASLTSAQWTQNTLVNTEVSSTNAGTLASAATSDGKTWLAYYKQVLAPNNYEMRAQLLDKDGVKLLGNEGVLVNNIPSASFTSTYNIAVDANNNLIVAFASTTSPNTVYVNKLTTAGAQICGSEGVNFPNALNPKLAVMANGDVIVSWIDLIGGTRAKMQRLAAATGSSVWATPADVVPATAANRTFPGHILPLSDNGFIHVYHNRTVTFGTASLFWAQRYNTSGLPQWTLPIQLSNKTTAYNREYFPAMNNDTLYLAYFGATGARIGDAYVQKLFPDGTIPWGINGSDFSTDASANFELETKLALSPSTRAVWASSTITSTNQSSQGTFIQKFDMTTGARQFTDLGKAVYPVMPVPYVIPIGISTFSDNLPVLMLGKYNSATSQYFYTTKLDNNGNFVWAGDTVALAKFEVGKGRMSLTRVVNDQAVATWTENKGTEDRPYAQPIRINGATGLLAPVSNFSANTTSICRGSSVQYTSSSTGVVTGYSWSFPGGTPATSSLANPVVTYNTNGTYSASLTVSNEGGANTFTRTNYVTVASVTPAATITGSTTVCAGQPTIFVVSGTDLGTAPIYSWMVNGIAVANTGSSFTYTNNTAGTYQISCNVTSNATCAQPTVATSNIITLTVNSYPVISLSTIPATVCISDTAFILSGSPSGGIFSGTGVSGTNLFTPSIAGLGNHTVTYTVTQSGCTSVETKIINVKECAERHLRLNQYPAIILLGNPNNGRFNLRLNSDIYTNLNFVIYNSLGQKVKSQQVTGLHYGSVIPLNISEKSAGVYHLLISNNETGKEAKKGFSIIKY